MLAWLSYFWRWGARNIWTNCVALFFSYSCWMGGVALCAVIVMGVCEFASGLVPDADEEKPLWYFVLEIWHRSRS